MPVINPGNVSPSGANPIVERYVANTIKVESWFARGMYWVAAFIALLLFAWAVWITVKTVETGKWYDALTVTPIVLAVAAFIYFLGWGWRWLWSGRTDNFFGRKKYTPPGRLEDTRQRIATVLSFGAWSP